MTTRSRGRSREKAESDPRVLDTESDPSGAAGDTGRDADVVEDLAFGEDAAGVGAEVVAVGGAGAGVRADGRRVLQRVALVAGDAAVWIRDAGRAGGEGAAARRAIGSARGWGAGDGVAGGV